MKILSSDCYFCLFNDESSTLPYLTFCFGATFNPQDSTPPHRSYPQAGTAMGLPRAGAAFGSWQTHAARRVKAGNPDVLFDLRKSCRLPNA